MIVVCRADEAVLRARLAARASAPRTTSDARLELWPALRAAFVEPAELPGTISVDTTRPLQHIADEVVAVVCRADAGQHGSQVA